MALGYGKSDTYTERSFYLFPPCLQSFHDQVRPLAPSIRKEPRRQARGLRTRESDPGPRCRPLPPSRGLEGITSATSRNNSV